MNLPKEDALIQFLSAPASYPHAVTGEVHVIQTHISWIFLTGAFAYKVKKPVRLSFIDFSTLEKREHYCEQELRLNRQLSPELYLDVVPIYSYDNAFSFESAKGEPVEYAVKMRQFREEDVLVRAFEDGRMNDGHVVDLARNVAEMHQSALDGPELARFGDRQVIEATLADHFRVADEFLGTTVTASQLNDIRAYTERFLDGHDDLIRERMAGGYIRECHGDLHLGNICFYDGRIRFFDRIEYNEEFKNIDAIYDLAFLFMDLQFRGRNDWAYLLANRYAEETGDYDGLRLLPFYACGRALVRAKVRSILSAEEEAAPDQRDKARAEAAAYFAHAAGYAQRQNGAIVAMCGLSGSGKSTVARELSVKLPAFHIRSDALRKHLAGTDLRSSDTALYSHESTERTYAELTRLGRDLARDGNLVILDATYGAKVQREAVGAEAAKAKVPFHILWCDAPEAALRDRLRRRQGDISDADEAVLDAQLSRFEAPVEEEGVQRIDTAAGASLEQVAAALKKFEAK